MEALGDQQAPELLINDPSAARGIPLHGQVRILTRNETRRDTYIYSADERVTLDKKCFTADVGIASRAFSAPISSP